MKIAVVSYATKNREWLYSITNPVKQAYCFKHGYDFLFSNEQLNPDRPPAWSKLPHIRNVIQNYDWVMWIDDDAMFANHSVTLESLIDKYGTDGRDIIIARDTKHLNTGVVLYRNTEFVCCFLDRWMSDDAYAEADINKGWEQRIFNLYYKKDAELKKRVGVVPMREMNSFLGGRRTDLKVGLHVYEDGDFIVHASGIVSRDFLNTEERRTFMADELTKISDKVRVSYYGASRVVRDREQLVVSFTSIPRRAENLPAVVESMMKQTLVPDRIVLYLHEDDFPNRVVPDFVSWLPVKYDKFEIRWADRNLGVHLKIIPALKDFPNDIIINIDDDMVYHEMFIQKLVECHKANAGCVCSHFCHGVKYENGNFSVVKNKTFSGPKDKSVFNRFLTGHGALYPPHVFDGTGVFDSDMMLSVARTHDEIWLWGNLFVKGVEIVRTGFYNFGEHHTHRFDQSFALCRTVNSGDAEDKMMRAVTDYIRSKIDLDSRMDSMFASSSVTAPDPKAMKKKQPIDILKGWKPNGYGHL